jgi:hypothetical protein
VTTVLAATVREEVASFLEAVLLVYLICVIGWIVLSFIFSMGVRIPYNRYFSAVMASCATSRSPTCGSSGRFRCASARWT